MSRSGSVARRTLAGVALLAAAVGAGNPLRGAEGSEAVPAGAGLALPERVAERFGGFEGCLVLRRLGAAPADDRTVRWGGERCDEAVSPCSTFKIPHAVLALDSRALADEHEVIPWDGVERRIGSWNRDHDLASALRDSVVWFFQETARRIGSQRMGVYLEALDYGNADISSGPTTFWLDGSLRISAVEQVEFLTRLARRNVPASPRSIGTVRRLLVASRGEDWTLFGKTGTGRPAEGRGLGWYVGWVQRRDEPVHVFALRIEGDAGASGAEAKRIARRVLADLGLIRPD